MKGWPKYPCHICLFDSRHKTPYDKFDWPQRKKYVVGENGIEAAPLVPPDRIIIPPLHVKLGLMRLFIIAALKTQPGLMKILKKIFNHKTELKISCGECLFVCIYFKNIELIVFHSQGVFDGPEIRKLINDDAEFELFLNEVNYEAWNAFKALVFNFFGNKRSENYHELIDNLISSFKVMDYATAAVKKAEKELKKPGRKQSDDLYGMSVKLHYLHLHRDQFPKANEVYVYIIQKNSEKLF